MLIDHEKQYKYDVAFSFLAQDESLALQINDIVKGRLSTFVYSEQQKALAGTDGECTFSKVFAEEARIVVVLYRELWGNTKWTGIEETAIKGRAYDDGYDFTLFVPLDPHPKVPTWLPKTRLWYSLANFGIEGLAAVIDAMVQQTGGKIKERSALDEATLLSRDTKVVKEREEFLKSPAGVNAALQEVEALANELESIVHKIEEHTGKKYPFTKDPYKISIGSRYGSVTLSWETECNNMIDDAILELQIWDGLASFDLSCMTFSRAQVVETIEYGFYYVIQGEKIYGWRLKYGERKFYTTKNLADLVMKMFIHQIKEVALKDQ